MSNFKELYTQDYKGSYTIFQQVLTNHLWLERLLGDYDLLDISTLTQDVSILKEQFVSIQEEFQTLNTNVGTYESRIDTLETNYRDLDGRFEMFVSEAFENLVKATPTNLAVENDKIVLQHDGETLTGQEGIELPKGIKVIKYNRIAPKQPTSDDLKLLIEGQAIILAKNFGFADAYLRPLFVSPTIGNVIQVRVETFVFDDGAVLASMLGLLEITVNNGVYSLTNIEVKTIDIPYKPVIIETFFSPNVSGSITQHAAYSNLKLIDYYKYAVAYDNEIFYLSDYEVGSSYLNFTHTGYNNDRQYVKTININLSNSTWTLTQSEVSKPMYRHDITFNDSLDDGDETTRTGITKFTIINDIADPLPNDVATLKTWLSNIGATKHTNAIPCSSTGVIDSNTKPIAIYTRDTTNLYFVCEITSIELVDGAIKYRVSTTTNVQVTPNAFNNVYDHVTRIN